MPRIVWIRREHRFDMSDDVLVAADEDVRSVDNPLPGGQAARQPAREQREREQSKPEL